MDRWGCIRFPDLPLQVALLRRPGQKAPFAVVRDGRPSSPLLYLNSAAMEQGLRPGMRYTAALSVAPHLQVDTVSAAERDEVRASIVGLLARWSPRIEPCAFDPEVFWVDASGLSALYGAPERWGARLRDHLAELGYRVDLVIGFSRRGSYVLARSRNRSSVMKTPEAERRAVDTSPAAALPLSWPLRDLLNKLQVRTVAELDQIPRQELARRLPDDALAALKALDSSLPLQPVKLTETTVRERRWDDPLDSIAGLSEVLREILTEALDALPPRSRLVESLTFELLQEGGVRTEQLRPAQATSNASVWLRLLDLRLSSLTLTSGVVGVRLDTVSVPAPPTITDLFEHPARDLAQGENALALIRARWGNDAVVQAVLVDDHRPESSFVWRSPKRLTPPKPRAGTNAAVRRIFREPADQEIENGSIAAGPFVLESATDEYELRRYWLVRDGREVLWVRQDGGAEPTVIGVVD